jgi:hypothetical protein
MRVYLSCIHTKAVQLRSHTLCLLTIMSGSPAKPTVQLLLRLLQNGPMRLTSTPPIELLAAFASESFSKRRMLSHADVLWVLALFATKSITTSGVSPSSCLGKTLETAFLTRTVASLLSGTVIHVCSDGSSYHSDLDLLY